MTNFPERKSYKEFNHADNIIRYLTNPEDESIQLTDTEKKKFDAVKLIHGYRMKFMRKTDLVQVIIKTMGVAERQAYNLINDTEKIFGTVGRVHKEYERQFLLDVSRKNIEMLLKGRKDVTKALLAHYKLAGLEEFVPDMPDFSKLEQHKYIIGLPTNAIDFMANILKAGSVKLADIIPPPNFDSLPVTDSEEVK